jgi:bacterioferritin (cytochrome b1)
LTYSYANEPFDPRTITNGGDPRLFGVDMGGYAAQPTFDPNSYLSPEMAEQLRQFQALQQLVEQGQLSQLASNQGVTTVNEPVIPPETVNNQPQPGQIAKNPAKSTKKRVAVREETADEVFARTNQAVCELLNELAQHEWLGVTVYNHYSLTIGGLAGAVLGDKFAESRDESITHHGKAVNFLLGRGGRPLLTIGLDQEVTDSVPQYDQEDPGSLNAILVWAIQHEDKAAALYGQLAGLVGRFDAAILNWAQDQIQAEAEGGIEFRKLADLI